MCITLSALEYKKIEYECHNINLGAGDQHKSEYKKISPMNQVPTLMVNDLVLTQSMAILEFLEENYLGKEVPKLMPTDPLERAKIREICAVNTIVSQVIKFRLQGVKII